MKVRGAIAAVVCAAALGCGEGTTPVTVSVHAPNGSGQTVPIEGADLTLLPFDVDSLYGALQERNEAGPEPSTESLEVLYQTFFAADTALIAADTALVQAQTRLSGIEDRASSEYREAFNGFEAAQSRREAASAARDSAEAAYAPARESYNRARSVWESSAWDGFDAANEELYASVPPPQDSAGEETTFQHRTNAEGTFKVWVKPGRWWAAGRVAVPGSTRQVYRWNVPFTVGKEPVTVELTGENATILNTY